MDVRLGRYELLRELGVGGMARVYLARSVGEGGFERLVAIKLLHDHLANEHDFVSMFLDEARLAARIRHPNVVSTINMQTAAGKRYLVMEYVEGLTLGGILGSARKAGARLPLAIALRIMLDVLAGLQAAHELRDNDGRLLGLVHRDVSPQNVIVGRDGLSRITDFGVALAEARLTSTRSGEVKGKLPYMSPEQIMSEPLDGRADVYAAGVLMWELLSGRRLFQADNQGALLRMIVAGVDEPPSKHNDEVPPAIDRVVLKAISTDLAVRFASAADVADAIEAAALESEVRIAPVRRVASFVDEAIAREPPKVAKDLARVVSPAPSSSGEAADEVPTAAESERNASAPTSTVATISPIRSVEPRSRRRVVGWVAAACAVAVAISLVLAIAFRGDDARGPRAAAAQTSAPVSAEVAVKPPAAIAETPAATATASSASATVAQGSSSTTVGPRAAMTHSAATRGPRAKAKATGGSAADFLPGDL